MEIKKEETEKTLVFHVFGLQICGLIIIDYHSHENPGIFHLNVGQPAMLLT